MKKNEIIKFLATGCFSGYSPIAPGTCGTILALGIFYFLPKNLIFYIIFLITFTLISTYIAGESEKIFNKHDDQRIVIDEMTGFFWSVFFIPYTVWFIISGFIIFRIIDSLKFYPLNKIQNLPSGFGIVGDDFLAGILTNIILQIYAKIFI